LELLRIRGAARKRKRWAEQRNEEVSATHG
jgi:hypothetical protein